MQQCRSAKSFLLHGLYGSLPKPPALSRSLASLFQSFANLFQSSPAFSKALKPFPQVTPALHRPRPFAKLWSLKHGLFPKNSILRASHLALTLSSTSGSKPSTWVQLCRKGEHCWPPLKHCESKLICPTKSSPFQHQCMVGFKNLLPRTKWVKVWCFAAMLRLFLPFSKDHRCNHWYLARKVLANPRDFAYSCEVRKVSASSLFQAFNHCNHVFLC